MNKAWIPEGVEVYPQQKRLVVLGDDVIVHNAYCFSDDLVCFTILCGENGWWVEVAFRMGEHDLYAYAANWRYGEPEAETTEEVADLIAEVSCRTYPVPEGFADVAPHESLLGLWWGHFDKHEWS